MIRKFLEEDANNVAKLIARSLREVNSKDYSEEFIEADVAALSAENLKKRAKQNHLYVYEDGGSLFGVAGIGPFWGREDESRILNLFVLPDYIGQGIGKSLLQRLEQDEFYIRARRIEVPSSITAVNFYKKFGYLPKNNQTEPDEEGLIRLEKFPGRD